MTHVSNSGCHRSSAKSTSLFPAEELDRDQEADQAHSYQHEYIKLDRPQVFALNHYLPKGVTQVVERQQLGHRKFGNIDTGKNTPDRNISGKAMALEAI